MDREKRAQRSIKRPWMLTGDRGEYLHGGTGGGGSGEKLRMSHLPTAAAREMSFVGCSLWD